jgi:hypothetical protein
MVERQMQCVTCTKCGWVHVAYTREQAQDAVDSFNEYYDALSEKKQKEYYGGRGASIKDYTGCFHCKNETFRKSRKDDCPDGCTIQPVICEDLSDEDS